MKKSITIAGTAAAALALAGCSQAAVGPTWQEALADEINRTMTASELQDFCDGIALFGIETPSELGELITGFGGDSLPDGDTTIAEWAEIAGESLDDIPFAVDVDEVTVNDFLEETGRIMLAKCEA